MSIKENVSNHMEKIEKHIDGIAYEFLSAFETGLNERKLKRKMEEHTMYDSITVSCMGFTGTLETLLKEETGYNLSIRDKETEVTHVLEGVKPSEIKLVSGRVTMC